MHIYLCKVFREIEGSLLAFFSGGDAMPCAIMLCSADFVCACALIDVNAVNKDLHPVM